VKGSGYAMKGLGLYLGFMLVLPAAPVLAQTQDSTTASSSGSSNAGATAKTAVKNATDKKAADPGKPKKVWTNDDVGSLKSSVSVVGNKQSSGRRMVEEEDQSGEQSDSHAERVRQYRDAIEQLRSQIAQADARIAQLKDLKAENTTPSGGISLNKGYNMVPPEEQVKQLEERKKQCQSKIGDLENEARKEGIDPGELR
jgi:hypothetical protein